MAESLLLFLICNFCLPICEESNLEDFEKCLRLPVFPRALRLLALNGSFREFDEINEGDGEFSVIVGTGRVKGHLVSSRVVSGFGTGFWCRERGCDGGDTIIERTFSVGLDGCQFVKTRRFGEGLEEWERDHWLKEAEFTTLRAINPSVVEDVAGHGKFWHEIRAAKAKKMVSHGRFNGVCICISRWEHLRWERSSQKLELFAGDGRRWGEIRRDVAFFVFSPDRLRWGSWDTLLPVLRCDQIEMNVQVLNRVDAWWSMSIAGEA